MFINQNNISIFFGDKNCAFNPETVKSDINRAFQQDPFLKISQSLTIKKLIFLHQVHGKEGTVFLTEQSALSFVPFCQDGDFIITNKTGIGLAVATADCLPILLYDQKNHCIAAVHAGWKGTIATVSVTALQRMTQYCNTDPQDVYTLFGPSACGNCYNVGSEFKRLIPEQYAAVLQERNNTLLLNVPLLNYLQLESAGVQKIDLSFNKCTIENNNFCSYRRDNKNPLRQMSVVTLTVPGL